MGNIGGDCELVWFSDAAESPEIFNSQNLLVAVEEASRKVSIFSTGVS